MAKDAYPAMKKANPFAKAKAGAKGKAPMPAAKGKMPFKPFGKK